MGVAALTACLACLAKKMAVTLNFAAAPHASTAHLAFLSDKNCSRRASGSCSLRSIGAFHVGAQAGGGRERLSSKKGRIGEGLMSSKSGGRNRRGGLVRAEIYIEGAEDEVEVDTVTIPDTQTAWIYKEYGPKEVLGIADVTVPRADSEQVLVHVHAAALNPVDFKRRLGKFKNSDSELPVSALFCTSASPLCFSAPLEAENLSSLLPAFPA